MNQEYSAAFLWQTEWGDYRELDGGGWETVWRITFRPGGGSPQENVEIFDDPSIGFRSFLRSGAGVEPAAELVVISREHSMSAVNYPATYSSFRIVNDEVAEIQQIQGLPRAWYPPFR
ncbi:hypothetical protein [Streptomyces sp. 891-h]|uniref:hypothetical protein n=1 Tax=Streptomyces sp. 891-h TaxID=2720714 RepID=UPI001FAAE211|nr:hypothetical protein [Streptomyces sp. 891-h]UNZ17804.1 hypothetical protein HC362_12775 [Streptomyces sp. 891-h]